MDIETLTEEFIQQARQGGQSDPVAFAAQYPEFEEELLELLPAILTLENFSKSSRPAISPPVAYPEMLGEFRLEEKIGQGGMGTVFRALQTSLQREVAIKILSPAWASDSAIREKFENESRLIAQLHHPNIVQVFGAGGTSEFSYYVMEIIDGKGLHASPWQALTLSHNPRKSPSLSQKIASLGRQAACALAYAHSCGIIHRDIKPSNLLLDQSGHLHVSDFGLATILSHSSAINPNSIPPTKSQDGTLRYMAPERLIKGENSFASDQYSLGLTLYELVTCQPAIKTTSPGQLIKSICETPIPKLPFNFKLPDHSTLDPDLSTIINKSISFYPKDRYPSMAAMEADLDRYLKNRPIHARPSSPWRKLALWARRKPATAALAATASVLVILLVTSISVASFKIRAALREENRQRQMAQQEAARAAANAEIADSSLARIFQQTLDSSDGDYAIPPSPANVRLLNELMPYYEQIASQQHAPPEKIANAKRILAMIASQSGRLDVASQNFLQAASLFPADSAQSAFCLNQAALAFSRDNNPEKALAIWKDVASKFDHAAEFDARLESVKALRLAARMASTPPPAKRQPPRLNLQANRSPNLVSPPERRKLLKSAITQLNALASEQPQNPDCQFLYALLLDDSKGLSKLLPASTPKENPLDTLLDLVKSYPDRSHYQTELIRIASRADLTSDIFNGNESKIRTALSCADSLLARYPSDLNILHDAFRLRHKYLATLFRLGDYANASRELNRSIGMLRLLAAQGEAPENAQEMLITLTFQQLQFEFRQKRFKEAQLVANDLAILLSDYNGEKASEFKAKLLDFSRKLDSPSTPAPPFSRDLQ